MATRCNILRLAALGSFCVLIPLAPRVAVAQLLAPPQTNGQPIPEPVQAPLSDNYTWDKNVVASGEPASGEAAPTNSADNDPASLAKRVEALEQYIRQQKTTAPAESLPVPAKKDAQESTDDAKLGECVPKKIDTIIKPTFTMHGRIPFDVVTYDDDPDVMAFFHTDRQDETGFRSFRLGGDGYIYENLYYTAEIEIRGTNSAISYKSIYMEQQNIPAIGHFRLGHFFEPFDLEDFSGDRYLTFMERAPAIQAFTPGRNFGAMVWNTTDECQDTTWFAGVFRADSPDSPNSTGEWRSNSNDWSYDARLAWLPYYDEPSNGRYMVHLGGSYSHRHIGGLTPGAAYNQNVAYSTLNGLAEFSNRSWIGTQAPIGYGAEADSDEWNQINGEFLTIWGPLSIQAEYLQLFMNSGEQFNGGYAFLSYFFTGENRGYAKDLKVVKGVTPFEPFFWVGTADGARCGWGAWEVDIGYSWVNLDDGHDIVVTVPANSTNRLRGFNNNIAIGLGWWQNPWSHLYFEYEHEIINFVDAGVPTSNANIFGMRWQIEW
jgi:phosphate-selective porin OprO and OprP